MAISLQRHHCRHCRHSSIYVMSSRFIYKKCSNFLKFPSSKVSKVLKFPIDNVNNGDSGNIGDRSVITHQVWMKISKIVSSLKWRQRHMAAHCRFFWLSLYLSVLSIMVHFTKALDTFAHYTLNSVWLKITKIVLW